MQLTKHHGLGNDFLVVFVDALPDDAPQLARALCHRTRGVGADGLILALPGDAGAGTDITMVLCNADGSRAEMSGNGIRCLAQAVVQRKGHSAELSIGTDAGIRTVSVEAGDDSGIVQVRVDMGPVGPGAVLESIDYPDGLRFTTADVGNPHLVIQVADATAVDPADDGPELSRLAGGANVEFISGRADGEGIDLRVWERGVGVTEACGTGACAAAQAAVDWGLTGTVVKVSMPGGDVKVELGDTAILIGSAAFIAEISYGR